MRVSIHQFRSISLLVFITLFVVSCDNEEFHTININMAHQFASSLDAAQQGKEDLIILTQQEQVFNLKLDSAQIASSHFENVVELIDIDIEEFIKHDSLLNLHDDIILPKKRITPLFLGDKLLTSISTRVENGVWTVSGIRNINIEHDIMELRKVIPRLHESTIKLYEISQLNAFIYCVSLEGNEMYYTNYKGNTITQPINLLAFSIMLKGELSTMLSSNIKELNEGYTR